jgi:hypothetical protein
MELFERSPRMYRDVYLFGIRREATKYMLKGTEMDKALEDPKIRMAIESDLDNDMSSALVFMPNYPEKQKEIWATWEGIPMYGKMDGWDESTFTFGEVKTGTYWSVSKAQNHGQLKFYAAMIWLNTGKIPNIKLHWAETYVKEDGDIAYTGKVKEYVVVLTVQDLIKFYSRVRNAWEGIIKLTKKEFNL